MAFLTLDEHGRLDRAWRLAYLLRGGEAPAVMERAFRARRDPSTADEERLLRMIVMWTRSVPDAPGPLSLLEGQPREAWALARVLGLDAIATARAMDCSRSAAQRFLDAADRAMQAAHGSTMLQKIPEIWRASEPPSGVLEQLHHEAVRSRQRRRAGAWIAGIGIALAAMWIVVALLA